ncbi:AraC family transcriptional regulator [Phyllobacterium sp. SB3]|uniref:AraC family transcriptional regulator n=1 Tax=Phyllobacterium sp. SB3 TaxID=3156073 RepID=UPI0032AECDF5
MTLQFSPYQEISSIIDRFTGADGDFPTAISNLNFYRRSRPTLPHHSAYKPGFAIVVQGAKSLTVGQEEYRYGAGQYLLTSLDLPVASHVTEASLEAPYLCFGFMIDSARLSDLIARVSVPRHPAADGIRGWAVNVASPEILDASVRLLRLLERPDDIAVMAPLIEHEILYRLLSGPDGPRLLQIAMSDSQSNKVVRAVGWIRDNFAQTLRIEDLAERINVSVSSLHHNFKAVTAMTPLQYQKQLRLHEARRLILVDQLDVGTAGHRVGYESPSQFSREYSRLYGSPPRRDAERIRRAAE